MMKKIFFMCFCLSVSLPAQTPKSTVHPYQETLLQNLPSVRDLAMNKSGDEIYFTVQGYQGEFSTIIQSNFVDGKWSV